MCEREKERNFDERICLNGQCRVSGTLRRDGETKCSQSQHKSKDTQDEKPYEPHFGTGDKLTGGEKRTWERKNEPSLRNKK